MGIFFSRANYVGFQGSVPYFEVFKSDQVSLRAKILIELANASEAS